MPDPVTGFVVGTTVVGGITQSNAAKRAAQAGESAADAGIAAQDRALESFNERTQEFVDLGGQAGGEIATLLGFSAGAPATNNLDSLNAQLAAIDEQIAQGEASQRVSAIAQRFTGAGLPVFGDASGGDSSFDLEGLNSQRADILSQIETAQNQPAALPAPAGNQLSQLEEINPLVSFLRDQGFEDIQESAAARGRLGAGGTLDDLTEFNTNLAATVVPQLQQQRFNQLATILGIGSNAATGQGNAALQVGSNTSNLLANRGVATQEGIIGQANAFTNTLGNLSGSFGAFGGSGAPLPSPQVGGIQNPNTFEAFA